MNNYIAIQDGKVIANEGGTNLSVEVMQKRYPQAEIKPVDSSSGVPTGLKLSLYKEDYTIKTPSELEAEGLDPEGNRLPTAAELEAEAEAEKKKAEQLRQEAELNVAKAELGDGDWSEEQITQKAVEIKKRDVRTEIYAVADGKHRAVLVALFGGEMQRLRDVNRYERAQMGEFTEAENKSLMQGYERKKKDLDSGIDAIEEVRTYIADILESDVERAEKALGLWQDLAIDGDVGEFLASV